MDASVVLRRLFNEPGGLELTPDLGSAVTSALTEVECHRFLDRRRLRGRTSDADLGALHVTLLGALARCDAIEITPSVLKRAAEPFPSSLGTLDAIHLATALLHRDRSASDLVLATHDAALGLAARSHGFDVLGC